MAQFVQLETTASYLQVVVTELAVVVTGACVVVTGAGVVVTEATVVVVTGAGVVVTGEADVVVKGAPVVVVGSVETSGGIGICVVRVAHMAMTANAMITFGLFIFQLINWKSRKNCWKHLLLRVFLFCFRKLPKSLKAHSS